VTVFEPFVAFGQMLPADSFVQVQAASSCRRSRPRRARRLLAAGVRQDVHAGALRPAWSPMVELLGARELARASG
jgi:hypothetical protein